MGSPKRLLTERQIHRAKGGAKTQFMVDGHGLHLAVEPDGRRSWILRQWIGGKEKSSVLGTFPEMTLTAARVATEESNRALHARESAHPATRASVSRKRAVKIAGPDDGL